MLNPDSLTVDSISIADTSVLVTDTLGAALIQIPEVVPETLPNFFFTTYGKYLLPKSAITVKEGWIFGVILLALIVLAIINQIFNKEIYQILGTPFQRKKLLKLIDEDAGSKKRALSSLSLVFLLVFPVFIYQLSSFWTVSPIKANGFLFYLFAFAVLSILFILKLMLISFIGKVFQVSYLAEINKYNGLAINSLTGLTLLPICLGINLADFNWIEVMIWAGMGISIVFYLMRNILLALSANSFVEISKFHLFLYFCSLEILPLALVGKFISKLF
jgi:hypothetical protein